MARTAYVVWFGMMLGLAAPGCAHLIETQTVAKFASAIENKDPAAIRSISTPEFREKALRHSKALDDFDILHLPTGKVSVVKVDEVDENHRHVVVEVGERERKLRYELVRDEETGKWLVDDIRTPQKRNGLVVARSVTEQMDLLLTVREFLDAWERGSRSEVLKTVTPELAGVLRDLPPSVLSRLAQRVVGQSETEGRHRPKATLDGKAAIVRLSRSNGKMLMRFSQMDGKWKVADVAVDSSTDQDRLRSLLKQAVVMRTAGRFLTAYSAGDKEALSDLCTTKLYEESLAYADLSSFPLPAGPEGDTRSKVTLKDGRANYILPASKQSMVRITLTETDPRDSTTEAPAPEAEASEAPTPGADASSSPMYRVEDVALYRLDRQQEIRISSFFVSRAWVKIFAEALAQRDLVVLRKASTMDFRRRVWERADEELINALPQLGLGSKQVAIELTDFHGSITEVHVRQGEQDATYLLREREGQVRVDDVLVLEYGQPRSLKSILEAMVPIYKFKRGVQEGNIAELQRNSSRDMNRLIWKQTRSVPASAKVLPRYLQLPLSGMQRDGEDVIVALGDEHFGARVLLVNEHSQYVVGDVLLISGPLPNQRAKLKHHLRLELADSKTVGGDVAPASGRRESADRGDRAHTADLAHYYPDGGASGSPYDARGAGTGNDFSAGYRRNETRRTNDTRRDTDGVVPRSSDAAITVDPDGSAFRDDSPSSARSSNRRAGQDGTPASGRRGPADDDRYFRRSGNAPRDVSRNVPFSPQRPLR